MGLLVQKSAEIDAAGIRCAMRSLPAFHQKEALLRFLG